MLDVAILWCLYCWKTTRANQSTKAGCCKLSSVRCVGIGAKGGGRFAPFPTALPTDANELQRFKVAFEAISLTGLGQTEQQQLQVVEEEMHTEQEQRHAMQCDAVIKLFNKHDCAAPRMTQLNQSFGRYFGTDRIKSGLGFA